MNTTTLATLSTATPRSTPAGPAVAGTTTPRRWPREPLLHFILLGTLLFAADWWSNGRMADLHTIVVDADNDAQARQIFRAARGRGPTDDELYALRRVWLDNEVLYREGLLLQVDKGDKAIRERVIFKALSLIDGQLKLPEYDDATLREWFARNRERYDEPARFDFQEAALPRDMSEQAIRTFVSELNSGTPGDTLAGLRLFKARPRANLVQSYGAKFADALEASPAGQWQALPALEGLRVVRLQSIALAKPAVFESLRGVVLQDWTDSTMAAQRSAAVRDLARKYVVKYEPAAK